MSASRTNAWSSTSRHLALLKATPALLKRDLRTFGLLFESLVMRDLEIYAEAQEGELYHYQDYDGDEFDAVIQTPDDGWSVFEIKLDPGQVDEAAKNLVRIAAKFTHNRRRHFAWSWESRDLPIGAKRTACTSCRSRR